MAAPTLSCIIVNYNTLADTSELIGSLLEDTHAIATEVIVVDNGSVDGSVQELRTRFPSITVIDARENLGFACAVNRAARGASGSYLLLLNPDMVVLPGSIPALLKFAAAQPDYGAYGGRTVRRDGTLEPRSCWKAPTLWSLLMFSTTLSTVFKGSPIFDPEAIGDWRRDTVREVEIVSGCLLLIQRDRFFAVGEMDEDYFLYGEDAEFSLRCRARGWPCVIVPEAEMVHDVGGSTSTHGEKTCMVLAGKVTLLRKTWPPLRARLGVRLLALGVLTRTMGERALRRPAHWSWAWSRRADWNVGYPQARRTLFGLPEAAPRASHP